MIATPFYNSMIDIAFGFFGQPFKHSRTKLKLYALVFVCSLTGTTNILVLEGLETQDVVVQAIKRHASRYGVPGELFIDNLTQLKALEHTRSSVRDLDSQVSNSLGIRVHVFIAKSHEEKGKVERKIRTLREMLEKLGVDETHPLTSIQ